MNGNIFFELLLRDFRQKNELDWLQKRTKQKIEWDSAKSRWFIQFEHRVSCKLKKSLLLDNFSLRGQQLVLNHFLILINNLTSISERFVHNFWANKHFADSKRHYGGFHTNSLTKQNSPEGGNYEKSWKMAPEIRVIFSTSSVPNLPEIGSTQIFFRLFVLGGTLAPI